MENIQQLSSEIFSEYQNEPVPIARWVVKTENTGGKILIVPDRGLLLYYERAHRERSYTHIWLCGVKKECRRLNVLRTMLRTMLNDPKCKETISVHLNRKKFPEMIAALEHLGFVWIEDIAKKNLERFEIDTDTLRKRISPC
jgi:hypothetical protein